MSELNPTLQAWLSGPRMPLGKTLILRPGRYPADYERAVQQAFGSLSFDGTWDTREIVEQRHALWDGKAERSIFLAPFSRIWSSETGVWRDTGRDFGHNIRPTYENQRAELDRIHERLWMMAGAMDREVEVVSIDLETFDRSSEIGAELCDLYYPLVREVVRDVFPNAAIEWYDHGGIRPVNSGVGFASRERVPFKADPEEISVVAYSLEDYKTTREQLRRTDGRGVFPVPGAGVYPESYTLWLGLRCGYPWNPFTARVERWNANWAYHTAHLARLAEEIENPKKCRMCDFGKVRRLWGWISFGQSQGADDRRDLDIDANGRIDHFEAVIPYLDAMWKGAQGLYALPEDTPSEATNGA